MKRFQFELQPLLGLKKQQQAEAQMRQLKMRMHLDTVRQQLKALEDQLDAMANQQSERLGVPVPAAQFVLQSQSSDQLRDWIVEVRNREQQSESAYQQAAADYARITAAVEALESLRNAEWNEYVKQSARERQRELDETVLRRWRYPNDANMEVQSDG